MRAAVVRAKPYDARPTAAIATDGAAWLRDQAQHQVRHNPHMLTLPPRNVSNGMDAPTFDGINVPEWKCQQPLEPEGASTMQIQTS